MQKTILVLKNSLSTVSKKGEKRIIMEKTIYLDLDGVLADFDRGVQEFCKIKAASQNGKRDAKYDNLMWQRIRMTDHFYDRLDLMPGAVELFNEIYDKYGDKCEILTGIPKPKRGILTAGDDKIAWAHRILSPTLKVNIVYREEKKKYCTGKDSILIDDLRSNIDDWISYGGTGIFHISSEDTRLQLREKNLL